MKVKLAAIALLFLIPALARADNIVQVALNPVTPFPLTDASRIIPTGNNTHTYDYSTETLSASFTWDTTTNAIYNFAFVAEGGPYFQNMSSGSTFAYVLNFGNALNDVFQLNPGNHANSYPELTGALGTFATDIWIHCGECISQNGEQFIIGTATVTAVDPVATPEPSPLLSLAAGLGLLAMCASRNKELGCGA